MRQTIKIFLIIIFVYGNIISCATNDSHLYQAYIEGIVVKVEYSQTGNGFLNPGHQNNHIRFSDGRSISLPGSLHAPKSIVIGKFNRIWFSDNSANWIRDVEILPNKQENQNEKS